MFWKPATPLGTWQIQHLSIKIHLIVIILLLKYSAMITSNTFLIHPVTTNFSKIHEPQFLDFVYQYLYLYLDISDKEPSNRKAKIKSFLLLSLLFYYILYHILMRNAWRPIIRVIPHFECVYLIRFFSSFDSEVDQYLPEATTSPPFQIRRKGDSQSSEESIELPLFESTSKDHSKICNGASFN